MHGIEQNVAATWRSSVGASRQFSSTEMRNHYLRMAEHYSTMAEAEELGTLAYGHLAAAGPRNAIAPN